MFPLSEKALKRERKKLFKFVKKKLEQLLRNFYKFQKLYPNASKEELYLRSLRVVDGVDSEDAEMILDILIEMEKRDHELTLNLREVANSMLLNGLPAELNDIVSANTASPFVYAGTGMPEPKLEETFTDYYQIVESIIPSDI